MNKQFNVGDKIVMKNVFCTHEQTITRVTKTCAIVEREGCVISKYKREYIDAGNGRIFVQRVPRECFDMNEYFIKNQQPTE